MTQELRKLVDRMEESDRLLLPKKDAQELIDRLEKAEKDAARLDWFDSQCEAYGFQDMHEGNRWTIEGPFANLRIAIDRAMEASK